MPKRKPQQPPEHAELTEKIVNDLCALVGSVPITIEKACDTLSINPDDLHHWLQQAEKKPNSIYAKLAQGIQASRGLFEASLLKKAMTLAEGDPSTMRWLLDRQARLAPLACNIPLQNSKHEAFAQLVARKMSYAEAYREIYGKDIKNADCHGSRLMTYDGIRRRVGLLKRFYADATLLTMQDRRRITQEAALDTSAEWRDRLAAVMHDAKLAGELMERQELSTPEGAPLPALVPIIHVNLPDSFGKRRGEA